MPSSHYAPFEYVSDMNMSHIESGYIFEGDGLNSSVEIWYKIHVEILGQKNCTMALSR